MWKITVSLIIGISFGIGGTVLSFRYMMSNVYIFGTVKYQKPFEDPMSDNLYYYPGGYYIDTRVYFEPGSAEMVEQHESFIGRLSTTSGEDKTFATFPKITLSMQQDNPKAVDSRPAR